MPLPLNQRLLLATTDFLSTTLSDATLEAARVALVAGVSVKERDSDTVITPEADTAKNPRLVVACSDDGRTKSYAPIRNLRVILTLRGNAKIPAGKADPMHALAGALELILDSVNLKTSLDAFQETRDVAVMLATREPGVTHQVLGDIRMESYAINVKAVGTEHTVPSV